MKLYFITSKKLKYEEARNLIPSLQHANLDLTEIQSMDPKEIIHHKLQEAKKHLKGSIIVEDAAVGFGSLNGFPGPLSKWMMDTAGVGRIYELFSKSKDKSINYSCIIGLYHAGKEYYFDGRVEGTIVTAKGSNGFHYDPIFLPKGSKKTFAQMTVEEKNSFSHRGKAFKKLRDFLKKNI